jgi:phosphatidylserine/phosphatidylglycerophosphate/cardiolipin synthase-like enzyme
MTSSTASAQPDPGSHIPFPSTAAYKVRGGNLVRPLVDGGPALARIGAAVAAARHSVWVTVAFQSADFTMPDGHGSLFDLLDRAAARGVDVRVIFWRPTPESFTQNPTFRGTPAERDMLRARGSRLRIRWDCVRGPYCHHQKSWLIDAGQDSETAFVGGINLTGHARGSPGHAGAGQHHDLYVELAGPAASDVHHNFVQRWNEASERLAEDGVWCDDGRAAMAYPVRPSAARGHSLVQIQRMVPAGQYADGHPSPGAAAFAIAAANARSWIST